MTPEFSEQYKSPEWQKLRSRIFTRDGFKCRNKKCKTPEAQLHCHHLYYSSKLKVWQLPDNAYLTLCEFCHETIKQEQKIYEKALITSIYDLGFIPDDILQLCWVLNKDIDKKASEYLKILLNLYKR